MNKNLRILPILAVIILTWTSAFAQDNNAVKIDSDFPVAANEKTDIIFTRSLLLGAVDSVPFNVARSGTFSLGIGYGFPIGKVLEIKLEPRATWHKMYFNPVPEKKFPTVGTDSTYIYEKQRGFYIEVPVGLKFKLARNADDKYKVLVETGFSFGFNTGSTAKTRREVDLDNNGTLDTKVTTKVHRVPGLNPLRYGPYARFGTNWVSFYAFYRMSELFDPEERDLNGNPYPVFPQFELGFSITL